MERASGGPYRLGIRLVALADRVLSGLDVRARARPWLAWLAQETGETATLSVPGGDDAVTVDFVPSSSSVVSMARVGRPSVPHATAAGKVMLAFGPADRVARAGATLEAFTERTITDPQALAAELDPSAHTASPRRRANASRPQRARRAGARTRRRSGRDPRRSGPRRAPADRPPPGADGAAAASGGRAQPIARRPAGRVRDDR